VAQGKPADFLESWSEWQDLNLRPPRPECGGESPWRFVSAGARNVQVAR
jgi:hypothetical protein